MISRLHLLVERRLQHGLRSHVDGVGHQGAEVLGLRYSYTHTPARKCYTNFQLYYFVIQMCYTNCIGHGHGYECHSPVLPRLDAKVLGGQGLAEVPVVVEGQVVHVDARPSCCLLLIVLLLFICC